MQQTTTETKQSLHSMIQMLKDKNAQIAAQTKTIEHLEYILRQRIMVTRNKYHESKKGFERMVDLCYQVFLKNPAIAFTYDSFTKEFSIHFPKAPRGHLGRRLRDLYDQGKLWKDIDDKRRARYWLRLEEIPKDPDREDATSKS